MSVFFTKRGTPPSLGKKASDYAVGESVFLPINGTNTEFLVVHQGNPDSSIYDGSCNGTWLLAKKVYEDRAWTTGYSGNASEYSTLHSYLNSTFFAFFNVATQAAI